MKNLLLITALAALAACTSPQTKRINEQAFKLEFEQHVLSRHAEKIGVFRGAVCNGEPLLWYFEGIKSYQFTCKNGGGFSLPKE